MTDDDGLIDFNALINADPVACYKSNTAQKRFYKAISNPKPETLTIVFFLKGNRTGGSWGLVTAWSAIMNGSAHPSFSKVAPFAPGSWPFRQAARLAAPIGSLGDRGPIQGAIKQLFPPGKYSQSRGAGKGYYSEGSTTSGWTWDVMTFDQAALQAAGANLGLILMSEPPPKDIFTECLTRLSGNGMMIVECTQLDLAGWLEDLVDECGGVEREGITYGSLKLDGQSVGEVRIVRADIHESCRECNGGHQSHSAIMSTIAGWPIEEREARRSGKPLRLSGRVYPQWGEANEIEAPPEWHQKQWDEGRVRIATVLDPADRRPWANAWAAIYPNEDVIFFQEWPNFDFQGCKSSPVTDLEDYRDIILESESIIKKEVDIRLIDGLFGNTPGKGNARTLRTMLAAPCKECLRRAGRGDYEDIDERSQAYISAAKSCKHRLSYASAPAYDGSVRDGHILIRTAIGNVSEGIRPKLYAIKSTCQNLCMGMRKYAWAEQKNPLKGLSDKPQLVWKDFPDLVRMLFLARADKWPQEQGSLPSPGPRKLWTPRFKPRDS